MRRTQKGWLEQEVFWFFGNGFNAFLPSQGGINYFGAEGELPRPQLGPAPESALESHPCVALSSAQVSSSVSKHGNTAPWTGAVRVKKICCTSMIMSL